MVGQDKRVTSRVVEVATAAEKVVKHVHFGVLRDSPTDELHVRCRTAWRRRYAARWRRHADDGAFICTADSGCDCC